MLGMALCGGGMKCAAHLGVLQVLQEVGVQPALLAGSSMGAVMAALYATGFDLAAAAEQICRLRMSDVFIGGLPLPGLNHGRRLHRLLGGLFGERRIEELPVALVVTACDLVSGETRWIDRGRLADALYASCALPGLFAPLRDGEALLADGCVSQPLPVSELRRRGARRVVGVHFPRPLERTCSPLPLAMRSIAIMMEGLSRSACENLDLVIQPAVGGGSGLIWSPRETRRYVSAGRAAAMQVAQQLHGLAVTVPG